MPETSTEEIGARETNATSEPNLDAERFDPGQFVKVTHLRPVADPSPSNRDDRGLAGRESPPALSPEEELTLRLRENRQAAPGPRWRLLRMLAPRSWRN